MKSPRVRTVHVTADGQEFTDWAKAEDHALFLERTKKAPVILEENLAQFLVNKSQLKAGVLKRDTEQLEKAWDNWVKVLPKNKGEAIQMEADDTEDLFKAIYDKLYALEKAICKYRVHQKQLRNAREYIPKLNAALKGGPGFYSKDLLMVKPGTVDNW